VFNIGGGRANSCSILEAFQLVEGFTGKKQRYEYLDNNREGDHICYISDLTKTKRELPGWSPPPRGVGEECELCSLGISTYLSRACNRTRLASSQLRFFSDQDSRPARRNFLMIRPLQCPPAIDSLQGL
jgi:hypothetical protein